jgi:uncharacterized protein YkwD
MWRAVRSLLVCVALCGCAATGSLSSLTGIGGGVSDTPPKPAPAPEPERSQTSSGGGIWSNFSSMFSTGDRPPATPVSQALSDAPPALDASEALRLINDYRATKKLRPISLDSNASAAAQILAKDMAQNDRMSHTGPGGADVGKRLTMSGYSYRLAAENVGVGQKNLAELIEGWKKSPPHSRNLLLAQAKHIGIAYEYKPDTKWKTFWTLVVAAP